MSDFVIRAADYCPPDEGPVDSATRVAQAIRKSLQSHPSVVVSMQSMAGAASSFFNVIFADLVAAIGADAVRTRLTFTGLGKTQEIIVGRSRAAVLGSS